MKHFRLTARRGVAVALVALASTGALTAQPKAGKDTQHAATLAFSDRVSVGMVMVPVVVRGRRGYMDNLSLDDFRLFVDDRPVPITAFDRERNAPVRLVFLQDLSGSMGTQEQIPRSREIVSYFLDRARPGDDFAVATFASGTTQVEVPFTADVAPIRDAVELWEPYGTTALHDAVSWLPELASGELSRRKAAILITDGDDNSSAMTASDARDIVARSGLPVYVPGIESGDPFQSRTKGGALFPVATLLNLLAHVTGGSYYSIRDSADVVEACSSIVADVRSQYVLAFPVRGDGEDRYRAIRVEVAKKHSKALHRQGYTGGAPATP